MDEVGTVVLLLTITYLRKDVQIRFEHCGLIAYS